MSKVKDIPFDSAAHVTSIRYRLHPLDVGFDLRAEGIIVAIRASDDPIRMSYPGHDGERRVVSGPQADVLRRMRAKGFRFSVTQD